MTHVRFLDDVIVQDELRDTDRATRYARGEVHDLAPASADRWVARGKAEFSPPPAQAASKARPGK